MGRFTHKAIVGRKLVFLKIGDANIYSVHDEGRAKDGVKTVARGQIEDLMKKRVEIDGKKFALVMLAEAPAELYPDDQFDQLYLRHRNGDWALAKDDAAWMAMREKNIAKAEQIRAERKQARERVAEADVVKGLAKLAASEGAKVAPAAPKPAKGSAA